MNSSLAGRLLLLTRPQGQGDRLARLLGEHGAALMQFPVTKIAPLEDVSALAGFASRLAEFSIAFFVSPNAVAQCFAVLARKNWPATLKVATVGPATARALQANGFDEVIAPAERFDSEGVLALPEFQADAIAGRKVLIFRGDGGRELLADTLRERGAGVETLQCYQRSCAQLDPAPVLASQERLSGIVFTSSEAVAHFTQILGESGRPLLEQVPVFAPHPRILAQAQAFGARQTVLTDAGDEGIVASVLERLGSI